MNRGYNDCCHPSTIAIRHVITVIRHSAFTIAVMKTSTAVTVAGVTAATSVLAYAIYFDYKRRNDTTFRKKLRESHLATVENMYFPR